jgi:hypothetical protein
MGDQSDSIVGGIIYDNNTDTLQLRSSNNHTAVTINSSEQVGIGTSSPVRKLDINSSDSNSRVRFTNTSTGTGNGTDGLELGMESLNAIFWNRENGILRFATNNTERMRILSGGGLTFNGDTATANALDDYEEGTWTPVTSSNSGRVGTWDTTLTGNYTKIGRLVQINLTIAGTGMGFTSTNGYSRYSGLPFAVDKPGSGTFASGSVSSAVAGHAFVASDETVWLYAVQSTNTANGINVVFTYYTT